MRVLAVIDSLGQGGAERSLLDLARTVPAHGVEVEVASLAGAGVLAAELDPDVPLHLGPGGGRGDAARWLDGLVGDRAPDVVHTTLYEANQIGRIVATRRRVPVSSSWVNTPYGPDHRAEPGIDLRRLRAAWALDVATARLVRRFHANAEHVADHLRTRMHVPAGRIEVIPRGRDGRRLGRRDPARRARVRASLGWGDGPVLLAVARHEHGKGLDVALDALGVVRAARPDVRLVIAGREGNRTDDLRRRAERADVAGGVELLGHRDDVADLLVAADLLVVSSRREGFPGVVVEALATETPVVATELPGVVEAGGPWVRRVPVDDGAALARAVLDVLADPVTAGVRTRAGRTRFETRFTLDAVAGSMASFWERVA